MNLIRELAKEDDLELCLYVLLGQGELVDQLPKGVRLLNPRFSKEPVFTGKGRRRMLASVLSAFFRNGGFFRKLCSTAEIFTRMLARGRVQADKLLWRVLSDGAHRFSEEFHLAAAFLEGGSAYYVADHVRAKAKAAFVHVDLRAAGYAPWLDRGCWRAFDKIFPVSEEAKDSFCRLYPEYAGKAEVFPNLLDREEILRKSREAGGFQDDFRGIRLLTVGRLTYQKGYDIAVEAMALIRRKGLCARWYVLGGGQRRRELERQIKKLGLQKDFLLLGAVENPYPYFGEADIYVHATRYEGRSLAVQEARVLGRPVVVSDCSGNRSQVRDGVDGLLCPLDPAAIANAVLELAADREKRLALGQAAKASGSSKGGQDRLLKLAGGKENAGKGIAGDYTGV